MKLIAKLVFSIVFVLGSFESRAQNFLTNGLVAFYPFNGNAIDSVKGTNNGTVNGATLIQNRFAVANSAYSFNGVNQQIGFVAPPLTNVANWTISAWIKPANFTQEGIAVQVGFDNASTGNGYGFGFNKSPTLVGIFSGVGSGFVSSGQNLPATNRWYHVVMARSATTTSFYLNGAQTPLTSTNTPLKPTDFTIGAQNVTTQGVRFFNGQIDDVRIYNRQLTASEISQLYDYEGTLPLTIRTAVELDWTTVSTQTYQVQYSPDLTTWINVGSPVVGTGGFTNQFFSVNGTNQFYRLKLQ